ncbi:lipopolysaccharide export system permease protein [Roseovarius sp. MBR-154]|jgi:lipopolysaccharide export system permease protein
MILHLYFARRFLTSFAAVAAALAVLIVMIELMNELGDFPGQPFRNVLGIVLLKMPWSNYEILPLVMILASVAMFLRLSRSSELVVLRASGCSAIRGLMAPGLAALAIALVALAVGNPIVAATSKREHDLSNRYSGQETAALAIAAEGLWLRQGRTEGQTVIFALRASSDLGTLFEPTFLNFASDGTPLRRIYAAEARLGQGQWHLRGAKIWDLARGSNPEAAARQVESLTIPSDLTQDRIIDSFGRPRYVSIWELPSFIAALEGAGFSARRYAVWYHSELARPVFLVALVLMSAAFTMRHMRGRSAGLMVMTAILVGFGLHYIRNFAQILGESGQIPVLLAGWAPPLAALCLAIGLLLHLEDG